MENQREQSAFDIAALIVKQLNGELSPTEQSKVDGWLAESQMNRQLYDEIADVSIRTQALDQISKHDTEKALARLSTRIPVSEPNNANRGNIRRLIVRWSIAASILVAAGISFFMYHVRSPELLAMQVPGGTIRQLILPDGTKVWLNAGTRLQYPGKFTNGNRTVILADGEAYFDVIHDPANPFVVKTAEGNITVLGTSFDVNAYKNDREEKVTVASGKVGLQTIDKTRTAFILPGERVTLSKTDHAFYKNKVPLEDIAAWRQQRLIFDDQLLQEVMQSLERKYNVTIRIDNKQLLSQRITMHLNNQPLTDVLTAISFSNHLKFTVVNDKLIVIR